MRNALIFGLLLLLGTIFALHDGREPRVAIEAAHIGMMQAVTNPRGEARITKRLAPCETVDPAPLQMEDDA